MKAIAEATTDPKFLNPWVSYVPESSDVPSPTDFLGHIAGAPGELSRTTDVYGYFRALAAASPRVVVETIGKTEEGRDIILATIADDEAIRNLSSYRDATARLADPRDLRRKLHGKHARRPRDRSTTSTEACTRRRPAAPKCSWNSPIGWRFPSSR